MKRKHLCPHTSAWLCAQRRPVAIFDVDGVTLDNNHRLPLIVHVVDGKQVQRPDPDWQAFHQLAYLDRAGAALPLIQALAHTHSIVFVTARVELANDPAVEHPPGRNIVHDHLLDMLDTVLQGRLEFGLVMRKPFNYDGSEGDPVQNHAEFKREVIHELRSHGLFPVIGVDDSLAICNMFTEEGLLSLRCHNHVPEAALWR